ncbi:hypothetical protein PtrSN002B_009255 [Pyrenophora tritici-repentis]|uniref:Uncharacterized protein n=2 Tax=Pyrenophora tritici-repentis TaxID=45151 RepID=A0A2W1FSQ8_9PLEO|nr:uncharacterized protein PTRG_09536 [Pyrenophora tritici-repentis Pt-1C-BFP]KAA8617598.1 hypothetical protein PtrV1_09105 [Pyrenophora tritici-repentis]EDU42587.1 predicted protein [Pyrenophora tritici-repentis Pt-1C-BFP]KAF7443345.1 hypothetical protein A1F99_128520 [Pyrenophora tritici-repentis]KAF7568164.1 hypothetical protein PtrM4_127770 [Pyrenophora tritici-repentis]KAG9376967.1 hypothetical protein A1F94_012567 [Pyrenophora tritici-repentis]
MSPAQKPQEQPPKDLRSLLSDLDDRADRILASLFVLWDLDTRYSEIEKSVERQDYIDVLRSTTEKMGADLGVVERKAGMLGYDRLFEWIDGGINDEEKQKRQRFVMRITEKIKDLENQMAEAKNGYSGDK